jgi:hypothetical protein
MRRGPHNRRGIPLIRRYGRRIRRKSRRMTPVRILTHPIMGYGGGVSYVPYYTGDPYYSPNPPPPQVIIIKNDDDNEDSKKDKKKESFMNAIFAAGNGKIMASLLLILVILLLLYKLN